MKKLVDAVKEGEGLLFHHWDTDGMASAALILKELPKEIPTFTPSIGNYYIDKDDKKEIRNISPEYVIVADMALPKESINFLKTFGPVFIFDHHLQDRHDVEIHHNPVIDGESPKDYPSASWVINEYFGNDPNLLSILGAFGDREEKLKENEAAMKTIEKVLGGLDAQFDDVLKCAHLLDSNYKLGFRGKISEMPFFLSKTDHTKEILDRKDLNENVEKLKKAIKKEVNGELKEITETLFYREMESPYNIISTVTRRLAWSREGKIVIVSNSYFKKDECQIYIRGPIPDSEKIIKDAKEKGYSAGGKSDVVGMVIPDNVKEEYLNEIIKMLKND